MNQLMGKNKVISWVLILAFGIFLTGGITAILSINNIAFAGLDERYIDVDKYAALNIDYYDPCWGGGSRASDDSSKSCENISGGDVTWVGDSYSVSNDEIGKQLSGVEVWAQGCKTINNTANGTNGGCAERTSNMDEIGSENTSAIEVVKWLKSHNKLRKYLVFALGTNNPDPQNGIEEAIRGMLNDLSDDTKIVLVKAKTADGNSYDDINGVYDNIAKSSSNVVVADWAAVAKDEYFKTDKSHPFEGYNVWVETIVAALKSLGGGCGNWGELSAEAIQKIEEAGVKEKAEKNKDAYQKGADAQGIPWQALAAIHWREARMDPNSSIADGEPLGTGTSVDGAAIGSTLGEDAVIAAGNLVSMAKSVYNITLSSSSSLEDFANAFLAYNRGYMYKCHNATYDQSPYVMNMYDNNHMNMTWIDADSYNCEGNRLNNVSGGTDSNIGALAIFVYLTSNGSSTDTASIKNGAEVAVDNNTSTDGGNLTTGSISETSGELLSDYTSLTYYNSDAPGMGTQGAAGVDLEEGMVALGEGSLNLKDVIYITTEDTSMWPNGKYFYVADSGAGAGNVDLYIDESHVGTGEYASFTSTGRLTSGVKVYRVASNVSVDEFNSKYKNLSGAPQSSQTTVSSGSNVCCPVGSSSGSNGTAEGGETGMLQELVKSYAWTKDEKGSHTEKDDAKEAYKKGQEDAGVRNDSVDSLSDCGKFVITVLVNSGVDTGLKGMGGTSSIMQHFDDSDDWTEVSPKPTKKEDWQTGDVIINDGHAILYSGITDGSYYQGFVDGSHHDHTPWASNYAYDDSYFDTFKVYRKKNLSVGTTATSTTTTSVATAETVASGDSGDSSDSSGASGATSGGYSWKDGWLESGLDGYTKDDVSGESLLDTIGDYKDGKPNKILLHYTECGGQDWCKGFDVYGENKYPAHFVVDLVNKKTWQNLSINKTALATVSGDSTSVQIEIIGCGGENACSDDYQLDNYGSSEWQYLAQLLAAISSETGIPLTTSVKWSNDASSVRLSSQDEFDSTTGIVAHMHAPGDDHTDTGDIWNGKLATALGATSSTSVSDPCDNGSGGSGSGGNVDENGMSEEDAKTLVQNYGKYHDSDTVNYLSMCGDPTIPDSDGFIANTNGCRACNCSCFSEFFIHKFVSGISGSFDTDGASIVDSFGSNGTFETGTEPKVWAVFQRSDQHTGIILGKENGKWIVGQAAWPTGSPTAGDGYSSSNGGAAWLNVSENIEEAAWLSGTLKFAYLNSNGHKVDIDAINNYIKNGP